MKFGARRAGGLRWHIPHRGSLPVAVHHRGIVSSGHPTTMEEHTSIAQGLLRRMQGAGAQ